MDPSREETRDTRAMVKRSRQFNRWRYLPLAVGTVLYWGMTIVLTRIDPSLVLSGVQPLTRAGGLMPINLLCACTMPFSLIATLIVPLYITFSDMTTSRVYTISGILSLIALGNMVAAISAIVGGNSYGWLVLVWQLGMVLIAVGCVTSASYAHVFRNVLQCQECGYPLRPSIEGGSKACPECGEEIPGSALRALDNLRARERSDAEKSGRLYNTPDDLPPPPPPLTH